MTRSKKRRPSTFEAIENFLAGKAPGENVWLSDAVKAVREAQPLCELEDDELGELIARHAILHQCIVSFDKELPRGTDLPAPGPFHG